MNYNLLEKKWIPVLWRDGRANRVGIRAALLEAGSIRQIAASNPMDNVALLRFLLAVLQWCSKDDRAQLNGAEGIPSEWLTKNLGTDKELNKVFNLLGDGERFMQAQTSANNSRPVADLFHELPGVTNVAHFRHIRDYREGACPGCVAIGLTRLPVAMTGKGAGKRPGINGDPPAYFVPIGETLFDTLRLNWPFPYVAGDCPCWQANQNSSEDQVGVMEGFTWTSRQFRISDDDLQSGTCMICGADTQSLVTRFNELNRPNGRGNLSRCDANRWRDPHLAYGQDNKAWRMEDSEKNLPGSAGQWRDWMAACFDGSSNGILPPQAIVSAAEKSNGNVCVMVAGIATRQNDKCVESWSHAVRICARGDSAREGLQQVDEAVTKILDPRVTLTRKKLSSFKARHPLRAIRHVIRYEDRPVPDSVRAALADRLPTLELAMFDSVRSNDGVIVGTPRDVSAATDWRSRIGDVAKATTVGSPLRQREAMNRAESALNDALRKTTSNREEDASTGVNAQPKEADAAKLKRSRKKKEAGA